MMTLRFMQTTYVTCISLY